MSRLTRLWTGCCSTYKCQSKTWTWSEKNANRPCILSFTTWFPPFACMMTTNGLVYLIHKILETKIYKSSLIWQINSKRFCLKCKIIITIWWVELWQRLRIKHNHWLESLGLCCFNIRKSKENLSCWFSRWRKIGEIRKLITNKSEIQKKLKFE